MIFDILDVCDVDVSDSRWHRTETKGKQGQGNYSSTKYLPRISVKRAKRIIEDARQDLASAPKRDRLIEMVRAGLGVPCDVELLKKLRQTTAGMTDDQRAELLSLIAGIEASVDAIASFMSPWPFIPSSEWVSTALGREVWPFFKSEGRGTEHTIDVPQHAAYGVLVYRQRTYESPEYKLCDAFVFKHRKGVNAVPAMFALRADVLGKESERGNKSGERGNKSGERGIHHVIDVTGIMSGTGMYFALFGVFHFPDATISQAACLKQLLNLDTLKADELWDMYPTPEYTALLEAVKEQRAKAAKARAFLERISDNLEKKRVTHNIKVKAKRANARLLRLEELEAELKSFTRKKHPDNALSKVSFHALDVMLPTSITKPEESEWRPIKSKRFTELAARLAPAQKTVKGKSITYTLRPKGSRIW